MKTMMRTRLLATLALSFAGAAFAAGGHDHAHEHTPLHGGVVVEVKDIDYELVARPDSLRLYLRDHGKPMDVAQAGARLTLLTGKEKQDVTLSPAGDRLEAKGSFQVAAGTKIVAVVSNAGKTVGTVRFQLK
jgi:hypothetical protein